MNSKRFVLPAGIAAVAAGLVFFSLRDAGQETSAGNPAQAPSAETPPLPMPEIAPALTKKVPGETSDFLAWAGSYLAAAPEERAALEQRGLELAREHTKAIAALIRRDPQQAIANAVPMVIRQNLPPRVVALLEKRINLKGALEVYGSVPGVDGAPPPGWEPYTRSVTTPDGGFWNAFVYGSRASQRTASVASLNGIAVGVDMAVADSPLRPLEPGERPNASGREVVEVCPVSGEATPVERTEQGQLPAVTEETPAFETPERIVYVCSGGHISQVAEQLTEEEWRQHWASQGVELNAGAGSGSGTAPVGSIPGSWTTGHRTFLYIRATFPDELVDPQNEAECHDMLRQMADYITQTSYGRCYFTYAVPPLVVLPYPKSWYSAASGGDNLVQAHARTIARAMGFDYLSYNLDGVRWSGGPGSYGGSASVGARGMRMRTSSAGTFIHELGHNLGVWHANFWRTTPPSFIGPGNNLEYGNTFDVMGSSGSMGQFTAHFKNILNWLPNETHWNVTASGLYRLHQFDFAVQDPGLRYALRIPKDVEREYWAEFRQRHTTNTGFMNGLMMTWDGWGLGGIGGSGGSPPIGSNRGAQLLDMTPGSFGNGITDTRNDSALWIGRTYSDPDVNIHITPVAKIAGTPPAMDVYVSVGAVPGNQAPVLAINASVTSVATGTSVTLTAVATDPDGDTLAYAWVFDDGTYSTNNNAVQTKSWNTAGHYRVLCTASDMKGGRTTRGLLITVGSPTTFTVSGNVTGPDSLPLEGVYVANFAPSNNTSHSNSGTFRGTWTDSDGNYTLTRLTAGSYTITPTLYPNVFTPDGFTNPLTVGPSTTAKNFTSALLPTITVTAIDPTASEGAPVGTGTIRIERTGSTAAALAVQIFNTNTGTATRNTDYTLTPAPTASTTTEGGSGTSQYDIPAGASFLDITVTPSNDSATEGVEYAALNFANTSGGYILAGPAVAMVAITDEENANIPVVTLTQVDNVATEAGQTPATLRLERTGPTAASLSVALALSGTATNGSDYAVTSPVIIPAGSSSVTFPLTPADDTAQEGTETATVTINSTGTYVRNALLNSVTVQIHDNDLPVVTVAATDATANETPGDPGIFTITRAGGDFSQALTVDYSLAGRAVHGADYRRLDGRAVIPAGATNTTVIIQPFDDTVDEGTQDVILLLRSTTTYVIGGSGTATVNINDNDASQIYLKVTTSGVLEPATGTATAITFQVIRPATGTAMTVNYSLSGTATSGVDFVALPGTIAFSSSQTSENINVAAIADTELEDVESVTLTLLPGSGYTIMASQPPSATGYIVDQDQPIVDVSVADTGSALTTQFAETSTGTAVRFVVSRRTATASPLTVDFSFGGTATAGVDYTSPGTSVTIAANATSADVVIALTNDTTPEGAESIVMNLTSTPGTYGVGIGSATMLVSDNDSFPGGVSVAFATSSSSTTEVAGTHNVNVHVSGTPPGEVRVRYRASGGTATGSGYDFTLPEGELVFPPGTTSLPIEIPITEDIFPEPAETIVLQLFNATGANLGTSAHTVTINNLSMPEAFTDGPSAVTATGATFNGRAIPNGVTTSAWFEYGPTLAYGSATAIVAVGSGSSSVNVSTSVSGFAPYGYHYRCVAQNSLGTTYGISQFIPSDNANLSALSTTAGTLSPTFTPDTAAYVVTTPTAATFTTVTPVAAAAGATVRVNGTAVPSGTASGAINLSLGANLITIVSTAQNGFTSWTYTIAVTRVTAYEGWVASNSLTGPKSGPEHDYDSDGVSNFMEFGLNTDPASPTSHLLPTVQLLVNPADSKVYPVMTYRRRIAPGPLLYTIRRSPAHNAWEDVPPADLEQVGAPVPVGDGATEAVSFRVKPSVSEAPLPRFLRLKVSE